MQWHELTIHTTEEAIEMISNFLHELGAGGVSIEESGTLNKKRDTSLGQWYELPLNDIPEGEAVIKGYYAEVSDLDSIIDQLKARIDELRGYDIDPGKAEISVKTVNEEDWANAWKAYFKPIRVSERLTIKPTWEPYDPQPEEIILELDPGMAFGTGTHPTTSLCLRTLENVIVGEKANGPIDVIDVGTGSGILAIASAKLGARYVLALDLDPVAVSSATENTRLNGLEDKITVAESDLLQAIRRSAGDTAAAREESPPEGTPASAAVGGFGVQMPVRIVVANILAEIIMLFVDDVYAALQPGGTYIASGIIGEKAPEVEQALIASGFTIAKREQDQDWVVLVAKKG